MEALLSRIPGEYLALAGFICIVVFVKDGIVHPARMDGKFAQLSATTHPKCQYVMLAIASLFYGTTGKVGDWLATLRGWLLDGFARGGEYLIGFGIGAAVFAVLIWVWIDIIVPGGLEPSGRAFDHFGMWVVSFMLFPMLSVVNPNISTTLFAVVFIGTWVFNKKHRSGGGNRSMAGAGAGGGRSF
ncbi:hypothetical protein [Glycomyces sp. YM15]|uniref:hypothetical protein n=1 Tax=Glycomyces sp. YM15 TaxID=2800446 RepID=UPI00196557BF|nr:hypothetical protein [Glycomyces sp. YM15]